MLLKNFSLLSLIILFFAHFAIAITPPGLLFGRSVIVNTSLYYYGGEDNANVTSDLYMLDLSTPFSASSAPWQLISTTGDLEPIILAAIFTYNGNIWRQGGNGTIGEPANNLQEYNVNTLTWSSPSVQTQAGSNTPPSIADHSVVVNVSTGIAYFFGGTQYSTATDLNTIFTLDMNKLIYNYPNPTGTPPIGLEGHKAALINGLMYILGGFQRSTSTFASFNQIPIYNTFTNSWSTSNATGQAPAGRQELTAIILPDGVSIIVFGGTNYPLVETSYNDINVLHTNNMTWSTPPTTGSIPTARDGHAAVMVGSQMVIMFGENASQQYLSDTGILDTSSWTWNDAFTPTTNAITGPNYNGNPSSASDNTNGNSNGNGNTSGNGNGSGSGSGNSNNNGNGNSSNSSDPNNPNSSHNNNNGGPSTSGTSGFLAPVGGIGGLIGIILGCIFVLVAFWWWLRWRPRHARQSYPPNEVSSSINDSGNLGSEASGNPKPNEKINKPNENEPTPKRISKPDERGSLE